MNRKDDLEAFSAAMFKLGAAFATEISEPMLQTYWEALSPKMDLDEFVAVCAYLRDTKEYMPRICHFIQAAEEDSKKAAEARWQLVVRASKSSSWTGDERTDRIVRCMGGPKRFGQMTDNEIHTWARKEFMELWESFEDSDEKSTYSDKQAPGLEGLDEFAGMLAEGMKM